MRGRTNLKAAVIVSVFLVVVLGISGYCEAEELYIVADINPSGNSGPDYLTNVNGTLFFKARNGTHGSELWKSDGTRTGTVMVKDINPGAGSSYPSELTNVNGTLFFFADDDTSGKKLWKSDGSRIGTVMVKDINPGGGGTILAYMINVNGTLFFAAHDDTHGGELWKSDGTSIGTVMVKDINPSGNSSPRNLTVVNGTLLFTAYNDMYGFELWKSDGTEAGTVMVKDINPGASGSGFGTRYLMNFNGTLFFSADDGTHGYELWKSDVTELGTVMVKDINPGGGSSSPSYMTNVNGTLFFGASDGSDGKELWKSDGTELGTVMVADINPGAGSSAPSELTNVYGTLFFSAYNVTNGAELWKSDGTSAGTVMVKDIYATSGDNGSFPSELTNVYGTLFFMAYTSWYGGELWKSDGTEAGTVIVKDIYPGEDEAPPFDPMSSFPSGLTIDNGTLYFSANDGLYGRELWAYTHSKRIFVDADANGANNGSSWSDAYLYLQDALTQAVSYDEIFVAQGTYKPDQGGGLTTGDRTATFQLKNCVTIKGGYAGFGEPDPDVRDITAYETILSGDLAGNDFGFTKNGENSYHVVTGSGTEQSTILDGFTITAGNADGSFPNNRGGGMVNNPNGSATITNCKFGGNSALLGGGMYNFDQSSPSVTNCTFSNNSTSWGGGMYNGDNSNPTVTNCTFSNNSAATNGGGMYNYLGCDATVVNCTFSGNSASSNGGGMFNYSNTPTLTNCILWGNSDAGGMDESGQIYSHSTSIITINYSCVQGWTGGMGGVGNIGDDPLFLDADGPDDIAGTEDDNLRLRSLSPCINAGDNLALPVDVTTDLDGAPRITGRIVDMGAYEWDYLVAHWKLDERVGFVAHDSVGNNHGTLYDDPTWQPTGGKTAGALEFDGVEDHVAHNFVLPRQKGTIWHWLNPNDSTSMVPYYEGSGIQDGWGLEYDALEIHTGVQPHIRSITAYFSYQDGTSSNAVRFSGGAVPVGEWTHVAVTWDTSGDAVLYVDGLEVNRGDMSVKHFLSRSSNYHLIGAPSDFTGSLGNNRNWNGLIDDVRIYNYALSGDEVRWLLCDRPPRGDVNRDCRFDFVDFAILVSEWLDCGLMVPELCG